MLEDMGYAVVSVSNPSEALKAFAKRAAAEERFSAVILDLTIPGGAGGKETLREIRRLDPVVPAFVMSGYAGDPVMSDPAKHGFAGSISKPFRGGELAELLNEHLGSSREESDDGTP
jgi:DNA-binding NtrC family response regulator